MKVVVIGSRGMLGRAVMEACQERNWEVAGYGRPEIDITKMDGNEIEDGDWIVNCAAYTNVDKAEEDPVQAFSVNSDGVKRIVEMCALRDLKLLQVSTDYVFDGQKGLPYTEDSIPNPINVYGKSKLEGEVWAKTLKKNALIIRTQALFGQYGNSFVKAILDKAKAGERHFRVVCDQFTCPTNVRHLAKAMVCLMVKDISGIVNVSASGFCSWYEFAKMILDQAGIDVEVIPVKSADYKTKAVRPKMTILSKRKYLMLTGNELPSFKEGLQEYLKEI
jgi:dTDP-4-dehydrorhamnose reductase